MEKTDKKVSHWPGPWHCEETPDGYNDTVIVYGGFPLATVRGTDDMSCIDEEDVEQFAAESVATAKLIAAAPELLEALKELYSFTPDLHSNNTDWDTDFSKAIIKAKEAINKATE